MKLKVLKHSDRILVEPVWDSEKIGSLYIPDSLMDKHPQQGTVLDAGLYTTFHVGDYVLFHRFRADVFWIGTHPRILLADRDIVTGIDPVTFELTPRPWDAVIVPDFKAKYAEEQGDRIYIPPTVTEHHQPVKWGTVEKTGSHCSIVKPGMRVGLPENVGSEIGLIDRVLYFIQEQELVAIDANHDTDR